MESPPSSTWSEGFILSDDSGLLLTNESTSNSGESRNGRKFFHFEDSDCSEKSLSQDDSIESNENFNTLKKAPPNWTDIITITKPIEPPLEFQDKPMLEYFSDKLSQQIIKKAIHEYNENESKKQKNFYRVCFPPAPYSPHHHHHHHHINSRSSSRLSSSHNSLSLSNTQKVDDSTFIKQAVSHDTLISDLYNVPFDSDIYAVPIDVVKHHKRSQQQQQQQKKRRRNTAWGYKDLELKHYRMLANKNRSIELRKTLCFQRDNKRHSVAGTSTASQVEPIHVTLQEIRQYLQTLYSGSSDSSSEPKEKPQKTTKKINNNNNNNNNNNKYTDPIPINVPPLKKNIFIHIKNKKIKDSSCDNTNLSTTKKDDKRRKCKSPTKVFSLKQMLCNVFRFKKFFTQPDRVVVKEEDDDVDERKIDDGRSNISGRALPPLPKKEEIIGSVLEQEQSLDFATSIQRVKDYGWYWGPISSEAAEKILSNEPDGSFIVRDSSDDHYIFSLTFKLNNCVRHVRIEHDQGNFSFGSCTKFKSQTIVEFIENAVEHSRSGRYLFFLHRRPLIGPVRVQLLHPLSRFKQVQTLQHICRFVIHKNVRRDLIPSLPLPRRIIDYLNTPYYYTEFLVDVRETEKEQSGNHGNLNNNQHNVQLVPVNNYIIVNNNNNQ